MNRKHLAGSGQEPEDEKLDRIVAENFIDIMTGNGQVAILGIRGERAALVRLGREYGFERVLVACVATRARLEEGEVIKNRMRYVRAVCKRLAAADPAPARGEKTDERKRHNPGVPEGEPV